MHNTLFWKFSLGREHADRRRFKRVPLLREVVYKSSGFARKSLMIDLSVGGAYLENPALRTGSKIDLEFTLIEGVKMRAVAEVRYVALGGGMGVEFIRISDDDKVRIARFVENSLADDLK